MRDRNPDRSPADAALSSGGRDAAVNYGSKPRLTAILHAIAVLLCLPGMIVLWNHGDWHESFPCAVPTTAHA